MLQSLQNENLLALTSLSKQHLDISSVDYLERFESSSVDPLIELTFLLLLHKASLKIHYLSQSKELISTTLRACDMTETEIEMCFGENQNDFYPVRSLKSGEEDADKTESIKEISELFPLESEFPGFQNEPEAVQAPKPEISPQGKERRSKFMSMKAKSNDTQSQPALMNVPAPYSNSGDNFGTYGQPYFQPMYQPQAQQFPQPPPQYTDYNYGTYDPTMNYIMPQAAPPPVMPQLSTNAELLSVLRRSYLNELTDLSGTKATGVLKFFNDGKNFGFLVEEQSQDDIFFHFDDIKDTKLSKDFL